MPQDSVKLLTNLSETIVIRNKRQYVRVLFATELEFTKILVTRLSQNVSNGNNESTVNQNNCVVYMTNFLEP